MKKLTKGQILESLLKEIGTLTGLATSSEEAKTKGLDKYLFIENAPVYGGYRLINVKMDSGAHCGAFGGNGCEARMKFQEFKTKLESILDGLEYADKVKKEANKIAEIVNNRK